MLISEDCGIPRWLRGKDSACQCRRCKRHGFDPCVEKIPWKGKWYPTPGFLPGKHGQRSLMGYSPWGLKEWEMTQHAHTKGCGKEQTRNTHWRGRHVVLA